VTFTIYEKHPTLDAYRYGPSFTPYAIVAANKRFTDAELMACHWEAAFDVREAEAMGHREYGNKRLREALTLHRFATANHFDE
jgi:hypothetical protein